VALIGHVSLDLKPLIPTLPRRVAQTEVRLLIDAEHSYFQPAIDHAALHLMRRFNAAGVPVVYNTYQCYRKDTELRCTGPVLKCFNVWLGLLTEKRLAELSNKRTPKTKCGIEIEYMLTSVSYEYESKKASERADMPMSHACSSSSRARVAGMHWESQRVCASAIAGCVQTSTGQSGRASHSALSWCVPAHLLGGCLSYCIAALHTEGSARRCCVGAEKCLAQLWC